MAKVKLKVTRYMYIHMHVCISITYIDVHRSTACDFIFHYLLRANLWRTICSANFKMSAKVLGILLFDEVEVLDFCGPFEVFSITGTLLENSFEVSRIYTRINKYIHI